MGAAQVFRSHNPARPTHWARPSTDTSGDSKASKSQAVPAFLHLCFFHTFSPLSLMTRLISRSHPRASAISRSSFSGKLSRVILLERFCLVWLVCSASCPMVMPRRFRTTLIFSLTERLIFIPPIVQNYTLCCVNSQDRVKNFTLKFHFSIDK